MTLTPDEIIPIPQHLAGPEEVSPVVSPLTVLGVLIGQRRAILAAYHARGTIWLGAALVLAAGLARDYDSADLLHDPWWLLVPYAVSAALALVLYAMCRQGVAQAPPFWAGYRAFLGVFWLMAPMALLYGIPWERWADPTTAVLMNLRTLAVVSAWRVILAARVMSVVAGLGGVAAFFRVMLVAGGLALAALMTVPAPVVQFMGGIRQTAGERVLASTVFFARVWALFTVLVWVIGGLVSLGTARGTWARAAGGRGRDSAGAVVLAVLCAAPFLVALPATQREQRLRREAEGLLGAGRIDAALGLMGAHGRGEFPPQWDPPPLIGWSVGERPDLVEVMERVLATGTGGWVRDVYVDKFERRYFAPDRHSPVDPAEWRRARPLVERLGPSFADRNREAIEWAERDWVAESKRDGAGSAASGPTTRDNLKRSDGN